MTKVEKDVERLVAMADQAKVAGDTKAHARLLVNASQLLMQESRVSEAINLCFKAGDFASAAACAESAGDFQQAAQLYHRAGDVHRSAAALLRGGHTRAAAQVYEAAGILDRAAALHAQEGDLLRASNCLERAGNYAEAAHALVHALRGEGHEKLVGPEAEEVCRRAGALYERAGDITRAVQILRYGGHVQFAGQVLARSGRHEEALAFLTAAGDFLGAAESARKLGDTRREAQLLAERARRAGRLAEAAQELERAGDYVEAARLYEYSLNSAAAARMYQRAGRSEKAAHLYERAGDPRAAAECLGSQDIQTMEEKPGARPIERANVQLLRARAGDRDRFAEAIRVAREISPGDPDFIRGQTIVAVSLAALGSRIEALRILKKLLDDAPQLGQEHLEAMYEYGQLLELEGHLSRARTTYRAITRIKPQYMDVEDRLIELGDSGVIPLEKVQMQMAALGLDRVALGSPSQAPAQQPVRIALGRKEPAAGPGMGPAIGMGVGSGMSVGIGTPLGVPTVGGVPVMGGMAGPMGPTALGNGPGHQGGANGMAGAMVVPGSVGGGFSGGGVPVSMGMPAGSGRFEPAAGGIAPASGPAQPVLGIPAVTPPPDGSLVEQPRDSMRPESFLGHVLRGRFRVEKHLGGGSQAQVFLARDVVLDRAVAIKILNSTVAKSRTEIERFLSEARISAKVQHSNSIAVYDFGQESGVVFMAMEFIASKTLQKRIEDEGRIPCRRTLQIGRAIAMGLAAAHKCGIIHRDVKPANVLVGQDDEVRVTDYGVATVLNDPKPSDSAVAGTLKYMAPEQASGEARDPKSDVYSLGVVLWEMLAGTAPFDASVQSVLKRAGEPPPELPQGVEAPELVRAVVRRCMSPLIEQRPTMAELVDELATASG